MTARGTIRGNTIHVTDRLPLKDGDEVRLEIEPAPNGSPIPGTREAIREMLSDLKPIPAAFMDDLERRIEKGKTYSETPKPFAHSIDATSRARA